MKMELLIMHGVKVVLILFATKQLTVSTLDGHRETDLT